jgi:hypothetical protein
VSAHRQHYFEANGPGAPHPMETRIGEAISIALLVVVAIGAAVSYVIGHERETVVTPVRSPEVLVYELPPMEVDQARIEGFRAGFDTALQQGCSAALSTPLAAR